ncbi:hypothetical protein HPB48_012223 [Haemaphysalis longicornis]|uniref:Ionotropic glutamate receptor C-terminal domain-containing protein n=1 Tax=Haemaphysalis longicornis TaxID=44386 RepID=A0A9J6FWE7_HAELO|nr:hypothetical protein HPB48_012223 [Haemaphysalis longicornis]
MLSLLLAWTGLVVLRRCTPRDKLVGTEPDAWFLMSTLIRQGELKCEYRTLSFRVLLAAWLLLSLVASSSYSCLLLSFMTVPTYSPPVDTAQRLQAALKSGEYGAGTAKATAQHTLIEINKKGSDKALREKYAYIDTFRGLRAALHDRDAKGIEVSSGHLGTTIMSLAMHKGCFYRDAFSAA